MYYIKNKKSKKKEKQNKGENIMRTFNKLERDKILQINREKRID